MAGASSASLPCIQGATISDHGICSLCNLLRLLCQLLLSALAGKVQHLPIVYQVPGSTGIRSPSTNTHESVQIGVLSYHRDIQETRVVREGRIWVCALDRNHQEENVPVTH